MKAAQPTPIPSTKYMKQPPKKSRTTSSSFQISVGDWFKVAPEIAENSVDLVICDLPYGVTGRRWDSVLPYQPLWESYDRVCKPAANIVLFAVQPFASCLIASNPSWFRYDLVWVKNKPTGLLNANRRPLPKHESILLFRKDGSGTYHPQKTTGHQPMHAVPAGKQFGVATYGSHHKTPTRGGSTKRFPTSVMHFPRLNNDDPVRRHPHQKPLELLETLIRTFSNRGNTVLDNTMGSGAAGLACVHTGRHFIGVEKDDDYFNLAEEWLLSAACPAFTGWTQFDSVVPPVTAGS
jgi:site-specific DNA-methyltransferase (adenine-specific)